MKLNQFDRFFVGFTNELRQTVVTLQMTDPEVAFHFVELQLAPGTRVLDVPCGDGRHTAVLAARVCRVTAVDLSLDHLRAAASLRPGGHFVLEVGLVAEVLLPALKE